jgi:selenide,water dikinase
MNTAPLYRDVVLAGGGYAHLLFLKRWCMQPVAGVRVTLVSPLSELPYSGMLPGHLAGDYSHEQIHIDLVRLCRRAGVRLLLDEVCGIDRQRKRLLLKTRPAVAYDVLSINTGPAADLRVEGVAEHAIQLKPVARFLPQWSETLQKLRVATQPLRIVMTGGGAGSVESLLALQRAVARDARVKHQPLFTLLTANTRLLPSYPVAVSRAALRACERAGITVLCNKRVSRVEAFHLYTDDSFSAVVPFDLLLWCGDAAAPAWLQYSGLALDAQGFVQVRDTLQSVADPAIFAAGDVAAFSSRALPKAGVFSVRQAPVLYDNLRASLLQQRLRPYRPQRTFLSLLQLGAGFAVGSYGPLAGSGRWLQAWKRRIDQGFMQMLQQLYEAPAPAAADMHANALIHEALAEFSIDPALRCAGCGGKLGARALAAVLHEVLGDYAPEDASITTLPVTSLVQSTDLLRAPFDDPWLFGRIATLHALNDLFAMGAVPHSLQMALSLPYGAPALQENDLRQVLQGVLSVCREHSIILSGGHSAEGEALTLTLTVNGTPGERTLHKRALQEGQILVLSKALGSGVILAAHMLQRCPGAVLEAALSAMNQSQADAAQWLLHNGATACTDITGFGLLGHLSEMLQGSNLHVDLDVDAIPLLPGARTLAEAGIRSSLFPDNEAFVRESAHFDTLQQHALWPLLLDPQTAGPLLAALPADKKEAALASGFFVVGCVTRA